MNGCASRCEHEHMKLVADQAKRLIAPLVVPLAHVFRNERRGPFEVVRRFKADAAKRLVAGAFRRVVRHGDCFNCTHKNVGSLSPVP